MAIRAPDGANKMVLGLEEKVVGGEEKDGGGEGEFLRKSN